MPLPTPTFVGSYVQEPIDFAPVATEADLIEAADDTGAIGARSFAELDELPQADIDHVIDNVNEVIRAAEGELNGYALSYDYAIPLNPLDQFAKNIVLKLAWISLRARRKLIDSEQAERERNQLQNGELRAISKGMLLLTSLRNTTETGLGMDVYGVTSSERVMSRETLKDW